MAAILALVGTFGLIGLRPSHPKNILSSVSPAIWALMALLLWSLLSTLWSPYQSLDTLNNAEKILLGVPLYLGCAAMIHSQNKYGNRSLQRLLVWGTFISATLILIDTLSGYRITLLVDPLGVGENPETRRGDIIQNLGHAVSILTLLLSPVCVLLWQKAGFGKLLAVLLTVLVIACAWTSGMSSCTIAIILALIFMRFAVIYPKLTLRAGFCLAAASILFAPVLGFAAKHVSPQYRAALPFSWEERVVSWGYMNDKIFEHPWFGHGFDAVRTFGDTHTIRGFEGRAMVSLHPHNAGIHLWAETGLIGVILACLALYLGARKLTGTGGLNRSQLIAASGLLAATIVVAGFSYGVWQDWWWASIIFAAAVIAFIKQKAN